MLRIGSAIPVRLAFGHLGADSLSTATCASPWPTIPSTGWVPQENASLDPLLEQSFHLFLHGHEHQS